MTGLIMFLHAFVAILLIVAILMQAGRGGGLTEGFASAESIFGARTNEFMIKTTTVLATVFFITCIGLAVLSTQSGRSLMSNQVATETPAALPAESAAEQATGLEVLQEAVSANSEGTATAPAPAVESTGEQAVGLEAPKDALNVNPEATATTAPEPQTPPQAEPVPAAPVTP